MSFDKNMNDSYHPCGRALQYNLLGNCMRKSDNVLTVDLKTVERLGKIQTHIIFHGMQMDLGMFGSKAKEK